jgi:hypothetical protein
MRKLMWHGMSTETYVVIITLLCIIAYLMGVIDADRALAEKRLWECQNPDKSVEKEWFSAEELEKKYKDYKNQ